jgi:hypothetical protein
MIIIFILYKYSFKGLIMHHPTWKKSEIQTRWGHVMGQTWVKYFDSKPDRTEKSQTKLEPDPTMWWVKRGPKISTQQSERTQSKLLVANLFLQQLSQGRDSFTWDLHRHGCFTSLYQYLMHQGTPFTNKFIWNLRIPLRIKIFLWYLQRGVILTKDNLVKTNWAGSQKCCFCHDNETIKHLFVDRQHAKIIWRVVHVASGLTPPRWVTHMLKH